LRNSPYVFNIYSVDPVNNSRSVATTVSYSTIDISGPSSISAYYGINFSGNQSNLPIGLMFMNTYGPPPGIPNATGILTYSISGRPAKSVPIQTNQTLYETNDISGAAGNIISSLIYTDNSRNTIVYSSTTTYNSAFGFSPPPLFPDPSFNDISANALTPIILNNTTILGVGYLFNTINQQSIWRTKYVDTINFYKGITNNTGNSVTFHANIYFIFPSDYSIVTPFGPVSVFNNSPYIYADVSLNLPGGYPIGLQSSSYTLAANTTTKNAVLRFPSRLQINQNIGVIFQIVSGSGTIQFASFDASSANPNGYIADQSSFPVVLTNTNSLRGLYKRDVRPFNWETNPLVWGTGIDCTFSLS
jgi:hypothetical protein